ncbi:MAG: cupin [Wenzhouxiangella sp.]|nr:MAG: cupin [Wenzhouxiangella sp.]
MTQLSVFPDNRPGQADLVTEDFEQIQAELASVGVALERWKTEQAIDSSADPERILAAYADDIERLKREGGYQAVDVVSMVPDHPDKAMFRTKFLAEHTHSEDEVRFFVAGQGLFSLHMDGRVFEVLCGRGDLIRVPANTTHWFDMGPNPEFTAIRLFNNPEGWVANFTGSDIADQFSRLEN